MDPLVHGLVSQPGRPSHIADGVETRHAGGKVTVDHHMTAVDLYTEFFEAEPFHIAVDAYGDDGGVSAESFSLTP